MSSALPSSCASLSHATALIGFSLVDQQQFILALDVSPYDTVTCDARMAGGIKEVREFANQLLLSPQFGDTRLGVIYAADKLTPQAQNALLKLLEEPPKRIKIILMIEAEAAVLPTVLSRCQRFYGQREHDSEEQINPFVGNSLERFVAAEDLAKEEELEAKARAWLLATYRQWCEHGRPVAELDRIESVWHLYRGIDAGRNKRLLLEQLVVSSL